MDKILEILSTTNDLSSDRTYPRLYPSPYHGGHVSEIILPHNWKPRSYQKPLWNTLELGCAGEAGGVKRAAVVWHRRAGKDLFGINFIATQAVQRIGLYWHLFPTYNQGRKVAWEGFTKEGRRFLDHFPKDLVEGQNDTEMRLKLKSGSVYQVVGSDSVDRLVGSNPVGVVLSEYSLCDPQAWYLIQPILEENGGWAMFIFTPRGLNHGWDLYDMARSTPGWFAQMLTIDDTKREDGKPVVTPEQVAAVRASGTPEELIKQEYYCSFESPLAGAYYAKEMADALVEDANGKSRIGVVPHQSCIPVHTAWDFGYNDSTTIWFYQIVGAEVHIVDYYENSHEGFSHYANLVQKKPYTYGIHYAPHDIDATEYMPGKTKREMARGFGIKFRVVPRHDILDGIEATRAFIPRCWFDRVKCKRGIEALKSYTKGYNEKLKVFSETPTHNWASHAADAFRYLAASFQEPKNKDWADNLSKYQRQENEYDIHNVRQSAVSDSGSTY